MSDRETAEAAFTFWARSGYCGEELVDEIPERLEDLWPEAPKKVAAELRALVRRELDAQRAREATWTDETANDRLEAAFDELTDSGIVALENAGYTLSDGWEDCEDDAEARRANGEEVRGAVFFHGQDVERAVDGQGLLLGFGAFGGDAAEIAREVVEVLGKYDLAATWAGGPKQRIAIPPFEWRKRAFSSPP
jgi:hypothetical protein